MFGELHALPPPRALAERLMQVCQADYADIPLLAEFLQPRLQAKAPASVLLRLADFTTLNRLYSPRRARTPNHVATRKKPRRSWTL